MASTHTEVYRRFDGDISRHPLRFLPLFLSELKVATRKKLPLAILYLPLLIGTVIACFAVYAKFMLDGAIGGAKPTSFQEAMAVSAVSTMATSLLEVRALVLQYFVVTTGFALLATTWYGSGLICEDRRVNAHLLYFARPLTRLDYFLGKFCTAAFFGALGVFVPGFLICTMAVVASPDFSFLTEQGDVFVGMAIFSTLWIGTITTFVLAVSSVAPKRVFAMVGVIGFMMLGDGVAAAAAMVGDVPVFRYLGLGGNLGVVGKWLLSRPGTAMPDDLVPSALGVGVMLVLSLVVIARRLRKMELAA
jgi:hypothetical protein